MDPLNTTKAVSPATYLIAGVALLLAGGIIGAFADPYLPSSLSNAKKGYQSGFTAARTLVENSSFGAMFKTPADIRTLSGTVTANTGNSLTLHMQSENPFDDPALADRTVLITASTTAIRCSQQDPSVFKTEVADLLKKPQGATTRVLPEEYMCISAKVSDIKTGDTVSVTASSNIKLMKEFNANSIQILSKTTSL